MSKFLVYQANKNIKGTCLNKSLRKDNKIFAVYSKGKPGTNIKEHLRVYTSMGVHFFKPSDFRVSKNQKLSKKVMGCY
ncbi:hypothetical protein [Clostridium perfringens]|uniref:hypothetical protein n=1 Tax=Clostridium perfringens TaxID=1502 RepID=UPI001A216FB0|nr:hypothetical protein [Clostridium perfringens]ELC8411542.1 hypothetical protein [Clostridium perfringens]HAT4259227.1 hypothetical protein [Clostridium perfringens]